MSNDKKQFPSKAPPPITPVSGFKVYGVTTRIAPPAKTPDWDLWLHMPEVRLWQAVALSMNMDPDSLKNHPQAWMAGAGAEPIFKENSFSSQAQKDMFGKRLRLLVANKTVKNGFSPGTLSMDNPHNHGVRLSEFAAWAPTVRWNDIPPELAALAKKPTAAAETKPAPAKAGAGDTATDGDSWQTKCRAIADELHAKDLAAGAWSSVSDIANRVAPIAITQKIRGPQGQLTAGNILREALQGDRWHKGRIKKRRIKT